MRITYVLSLPELGGGHKVIFQHVRLLAENGDEVTVLGEGPKPDWIEIRAPYIDTSSGPPRLREQDLVGFGHGASFCGFGSPRRLSSSSRTTPRVIAESATLNAGK